MISHGEGRVTPRSRTVYTKPLVRSPDKGVPHTHIMQLVALRQRFPLLLQRHDNAAHDAILAEDEPRPGGKGSVDDAPAAGLLQLEAPNHERSHGRESKKPLRRMM